VVGLIFFIIVALALRGTAAYQARVKGAWRDAANELGLDVNPGSRFSNPSINGLLDGVGVSVSVQSGNGRNDNSTTLYTVTHVPVGPPVTLRKQNMLSRFALLVGRKDVLVGDPFFDDRVVVDSAYDAEIREFLTPTRRAVVLEVFDRWHYGEVSHNSIEARTLRVETSAALIIETVRRLVAMAKVMSDSAAVEDALQAREQGSMADAAAQFRAINESEPNIFTQSLEAEALIELGNHEQAAQVLHEVDASLGVERGPDGWERLADAPAPVTLPAPVSLPAPEASAGAGALPMGQQAVIDDLFDAGRLSYNVVEHFEQHYANHAVAWSGTVTAAHSYRHDSDFGEGPGTKATLLLGGAGRSSLISNEVHAVVQLPNSAVLATDQTIAFSGVLFRVDRFARKLYIAHGTISA